MERLTLAGNERLIREGEAMFVRSWLTRSPGRLCLTQQRLVFIACEFLDVPFAEAERLGHWQQIRFEVPRDNWISASLGRARKREEALLVESSDGFTYKLITKANEDWQGELSKLIAQDRAAMDQLLEQLKPPAPKPDPYR